MSSDAVHYVDQQMDSVLHEDIILNHSSARAYGYFPNPRFCSWSFWVSNTFCIYFSYDSKTDRTNVKKGQALSKHRCVQNCMLFEVLPKMELISNLVLWAYNIQCVRVSIKSTKLQCVPHAVLGFRRLFTCSLDTFITFY